jgi:hypothetical protein
VIFEAHDVNAEASAKLCLRQNLVETNRVGNNPTANAKQIECDLPEPFYLNRFYEGSDPLRIAPKALIYL